MRALALGALLAAAIAAPHPAEACGRTPEAAFSRFIAAFNALDWPAFADCLAANVSLFTPANPGAVSLHRLDGRAEVERSFRAVFDAAAAEGPEPRGPGIHPEHVQLQTFGAGALVTFEFKRAGNSFGRRSILFVREGGDWRIGHIHASNVDEAR